MDARILEELRAIVDDRGLVSSLEELHTYECDGLVDRRVPGQQEAAETLSAKTLELCIEAGGSITGEHGVGVDKKKMMSKMFAEPDLLTMQRVRCAFDPQQLSNPTKIFPTPRLCGEKPGEYTPHPLESSGLAERF